MILRLAASAAVHSAAGVAMGVTGVLAACTLAQVAKRGANAARRDARQAAPSEPGTAPEGHAPP